MKRDEWLASREINQGSPYFKAPRILSDDEIRAVIRSSKFGQIRTDKNLNNPNKQ